MKTIKRMGLLVLVLFLMTGCFKRDSLENIEIVTTVYPLEYITSSLYGEHAVISSIYPDDTNTSTYSLSEKQLKDYSKKELFIYNHLSNDKDTASELLNRNTNLLIIDSAFGMELTYGVEELWLNPSHLLMMTQNIRNGLKEYLTNSYLEKEIDDNYEALQLALSELDAEIKLAAENAVNKTIVVSNDTLKYLEKYGLNVISLDEKNGVPSEKVVNNVINLFKNKEVDYLFMFEYDTENPTITKVIDQTNCKTKTFRRLDNITDQERDDKEDYISLMSKNIEALQEELYQ